MAQVLGLENEIDVTDDIEAADAILATSYEMKQNPWIRSVAKFHHLPVFVIKVLFTSITKKYTHSSFRYLQLYRYTVKHYGSNGQGNTNDYKYRLRLYIQKTTKDT